MNDKQKLNDKSRRYFLFRTIFQGTKKVFNSARKALLFGIIIAVFSAFMWSWVHLQPHYLTLLTTVAASLWIVFIATCLLYIFGYIRHQKEYYENLERIGFTNSAGEAPMLINRNFEDGKELLTFYSKGITAKDWCDRADEIQSALNLTISKVSTGNDFRTVVVEVAPPNAVFDLVIPWKINLINYNDDSDIVLGETISGGVVHVDIDKQPHLLIGGSTGSGKTQLLKVIASQALYRNDEVYIADMKGLDFFALEDMGAKICTTPEAVLELLNNIDDKLNERIKLFRDAKAYNFKDFVSKTQNTSIKRIFIVVDECAMLTDSGVGKEAKQISAQIVDKLSTIARMGRAVGIHLIIATQRPDANAVPGSIKSNLGKH